MAYYYNSLANLVVLCKLGRLKLEKNEIKDE